MAYQASSALRLRSSKITPGILVLVLWLVFLNSAFASVVNFDIPAEPAPDAIRAFIKQANVQVTYRYDDLKDVKTGEVKGEMEPADALKALLAGTGFEAAQAGTNGFVVRKTAKAETGSVRGSITFANGAPAPEVLVVMKETMQSVSTDPRGEYVFPAVAPGTYTLVVSSSGYQPLHITDVVVNAGKEVSLSEESMRKESEVASMEPYEVKAKTIAELEKYLVTDTKPEPFSDRNVDLPRTVDDVQPYYIFNSQTIDESGTTDVEDFLRQRLTMDTTVQTNSQVTRYTTQAYSPNGSTTTQVGNTASSINLQGLGADHTLILVDGLPLAGVSVFGQGSASAAAPGQPDVNGIPLAAIDRIEVLPSSAGAIYGAGAEGGVINIILKKAYSGGDITATYASTWDGHGPSRTLEATFGKSFEHGKTQLFVTAQYSDQSPMYVRDRVALLDRGYATLVANDPSYLGIGNPNTATHTYFPPVGATPNIASYATFYPVPAGTPGARGPYAPGTTLGQGGLPTTAADPYLIREALPLTLKSTGLGLGGANPYIATLPAGYSLGSNPSSIIGGSWNSMPGEDNEAPNGLLVPLGNYPRRKSIMATLSRQMTPWLQLHIDFSNNENHSYSDYNPIWTQSGRVVVPATSPINPFNQTVDVSFPVNDNAPAVSTTTTNTITAGGTVRLPFDWVAHLDYQWSRGAFESYTQGGYFGGLTTPFAVTPTFGNVNVVQGNGTTASVNDPYPTPLFTGAINPFVDTLANPIDWAPFTNSMYQTGITTSNDLVLAASGPVWHLPWGDPRLSIRLEHNKSGEPQGAVFAEAPTATPYPGLPTYDWYTETSYGQSQSVDSANAEIDLPLFKSRLPLLHSLDAQFNFSNETTTVGTGSPGSIVVNPYPYNYVPNFASSATSNGFGNGTLPPTLPDGRPYRYRTVDSNTSLTGPALSYKPTADVIIRFSVAGGYVAPTYSQLLPLLNQPANSNGFIDSDPKNPQAGGYTVSEIDGGNPQLKPTTSKSWDVGFIWEPQSGVFKGLRWDAEFTETKQHNLIANVSDDYLVANEAAFPNLVVRDPVSGLVTTVYNEPININEAKQDSWNFTLDYQWTTGIGSFELTGAETIEEHVQQQVSQGGPMLEYVGYPNSGGVAKTKATGTLRWAFRNWVASWTVVYFDGYKQYGAPGDPEDYQGNPYGYGTAGSPSWDTYYSQAQGGYTIPSQMYHNFYLSYAFHKTPFGSTSRMGRWANDLLSDVRISFVVNNVFNTLPAYDAFYAPFYASPYGDIQLRNYSISIKRLF